MGFEYKISSDDKTYTIHFSGEIDENADFSALNILPNKALVIDLNEVRYLNSMGLRSWIYWIRSLKSKQVQLRNCHPGIIHQINVLEGFLPLGGVVESFWVPYFCESCEKAFNEHASRGVDYQEVTADQSEMLNIPMEKPCPKCGETSDIDVIPSHFFKFLGKRTRRGA